MKEIDSVVILEEERDTLERAYYEFQGLKNLVTDINASAQKTSDFGDRVIKAYVQAHTAYNIAWNAILSKYFGSKYTNGPFSWGCEFTNNIVRIYSSAN